MLSIKENVLEYESTLGTYQSERISPMLEIDGAPTTLRIQHVETLSWPNTSTLYNVPQRQWGDQLNFDIQTKNPNFRLKFPLAIKNVKQFRQKLPRSIQRSVQHMKAAESVLTSCKAPDIKNEKNCVRIAKVPEGCKYCKNTGLTISKILNFETLDKN